MDGDLVIEDRPCAYCKRVYKRDKWRAQPGWEPASEGWRCPTCARSRHAELRERARVLIGQTEPSWQLVADPPGEADPGVLATAQELLLARGGLTHREAVALRRALLGS
jgi:hypothetical protein